MSERIKEKLARWIVNRAYAEALSDYRKSKPDQKPAAGPREFWIDQDGVNASRYIFTQPTLHDANGKPTTIHVVEASAYAAVVRELEKVRAELSIKKNAVTKGFFDSVVRERDELRRELDRATAGLQRQSQVQAKLEAELEKISGNPSTLYYGVVAERDELLQRLADYEHETLTVKEALAERDRYRALAEKLAGAIEDIIPRYECWGSLKSVERLRELLAEYAKAGEGK